MTNIEPEIKNMSRNLNLTVSIKKNNIKDMKIIFFGTPEIAVASLLKLANDPDITVEAVVTQPDKKTGRKQIISQSAIKKVAIQLGIKVLQPNNKAQLKEVLKDYNDIDFFVVIAFGMIIKKEVLDIPKYASINVHASLLPYYRGASPIQESIKNGDEFTGITIMKMDEKLDHGNIYILEKIKIEANDTSETLSTKLSIVSAFILPETLKDIKSGMISSIPQNHEKATFCSKIEKTDGKINWNEDANTIYNKLRAYTPWPGIYTEIDRKKIKILSAEISSEQVNQGKFLVKEKQLYIGAANKSLKLNTIQVEGKKPMDYKTFINGYQDLIKNNS